MDASNLNINFSSKSLWEDLELMKNRKKKMVYIFIVIYTITYSCHLNGDCNHGVDGGKFMCMIRWGGDSEGVDWIPSHMGKCLDTENIV